MQVFPLRRRAEPSRPRLQYDFRPTRSRPALRRIRHHPAEQLRLRLRCLAEQPQG